MNCTKAAGKMGQAAQRNAAVQSDILVTGPAWFRWTPRIKPCREPVATPNSPPIGPTGPVMKTVNRKLP